MPLGSIVNLTVSVGANMNNIWLQITFHLVLISLAIAHGTLSIHYYPNVKEHNVPCVRILARDREGFKKS